MKITFNKENLKFLGTEEKTSKATGNKYQVVTFLDGATTHTLYSKVEVPNYTFGTEFNALFVAEYNTKYPSISILEYGNLK